MKPIWEDAISALLWKEGGAAGKEDTAMTNFFHFLPIICCQRDA